MTTEQFSQKYNGRIIRDDGAYMSREAKSFFRDMTAALKKSFAKFNITIVKTTVSHYDCCWFCERNGKLAYISYSIRRGLPLNLQEGNCFQGFLCRSVRDLHDYTGGTNHFSNLTSLPGLTDMVISQS